MFNTNLNIMKKSIIILAGSILTALWAIGTIVLLLNLDKAV